MLGNVIFGNGRGRKEQNLFLSERLVDVGLEKPKAQG